MNKDIKYLCVGTFSPWKRQRDIAYLGKDLYCIGTIQEDGYEDYQAVVDAGATVEAGYFPAEHIRELYRRAQRVIIPGYEGSGRTVLEAMSMGLPVEAAEDNLKCQSYLQEFRESGLKSRDFILENYSEEVFCKQLLKGIEDK